MVESLRSTAPVAAAGGFPARSNPRATRSGETSAEAQEKPQDRVELEPQVLVARHVLRERVLACTRIGLGLAQVPDAAPAFAEAIDTEPVAAFLGRLLSAQNQLAAPRVRDWGPVRVRQGLDAALRTGAQEAIEMFATHLGGGDPAIAVIHAVLAEYERRVAAAPADAP